MAIVYLRSTDGNDADDGSTWALAKATLAAALTAAGDGGTVYVSQAHAETQAGAMTLASPGTVASPARVVCANDGAEPPTTRATTATVTVSGNTSITYSGYWWSYGVSYKSAGTGSPHLFGDNTNAFWFRSEAGLIECTANAATRIFIGRLVDVPQVVDLVNTPVKFANASANIAVTGHLNWVATANAVQGTAPTVLFLPTNAGRHTAIRMVGVDLSALASGTSIFNLTTTVRHLIASLVDCKLGSSVSIVNGSAPQRGIEVDVVNCDSADTNYRYYKHRYQGTDVQETTVVRSGGANDGTTSIARKIVTSAGAWIHSPFESDWVTWWNETLGSVTITIPVITDNVTLTDAEAWVEVEYLGTSGYPLGAVVSDRVSDPIFGTPANQTTDATSSWTTTGLGTPVKQSLSVTFTPAEKGIVRARVCIAKASTTVYYDPKALTTSARQYQSTAGYVNEGGPGAQPNIFDSAIIRAVHP